MTLYERLKSDLLTAHKQRDKVATAVIRTLIGELDNAAAVEVAETRSLAIETLAHASDSANSVPRKLLSEQEMRAVVQGVADEMAMARDDYERMGQSAELQAQIAVVNRYLA